MTDDASYMKEVVGRASKRYIESAEAQLIPGIDDEDALLMCGKTQSSKHKGRLRVIFASVVALLVAAVSYAKAVHR